MKKQKINKKIKTQSKAKKVKISKVVKTVKAAKSVKIAKKIKIIANKTSKTIKANKSHKVARKVKSVKRVRKAKNSLFHYGGLGEGKGRLVILVTLIIFMLSYMALSRFISLEEDSSVQTPAQTIKKQEEKTPLEREISQMVKGYPIEKMMPYILEQNPKTAMFLVAIAKKESAWGKRKPVLDGQDCFNYWGFRLKAERMGSGGHTCFESPKEAVETVAERIDQLVEEEDIDTPSDMIVWKCGYACQDKPKSISEKKWINDVDFYYSAMNEYL